MLVIIQTDYPAACNAAETLIVWTEPDGVDYALSFQDPEGCAEVWHFIEEVQRHMNITRECSALLQRVSHLRFHLTADCS